MKKPYLLVAVVGLVVAGGGAWWYQNKLVAAPTEAVAGSAPSNASNSTAGAAAGAGGPAKPTAVEVAQVDKAKLVDETQSVGSLRSFQGVVLRPEVGGRVSQILFKDGQRVKKGQVLVQFDDQLPAAQLMQSKAELSIAQANHTRNQELVSQNFISKRSLDESDAALQVALAKLSLAQATLQRLKVVAPFDGVAGLRQINVGDYLKDGADMVNIEDIDAVLLDFRLSENFQARIKPGQKAQVSFDALPGKKFTAVVQAIDPLIDANGRSVGVRGCIDNRQQQLRPGMFARVSAVFGERIDALVISPRMAELHKLMPFKLPPDLSKYVLSPMPGLLVEVSVTPGQKVQAGERVAVIEAMKMENVLFAAADGVVKQVVAAKGESLTVDQMIVEFE
jgi:membrane fusion protein (multidrug efflux system)